MLSVIRIAARRLTEFFRGAERTSPAELLHAARVLLWVRWFGLTAAFLEIHYRVDYGSLSHLLNTLYCLGFMTANGYVQYRIRRSGTVKPAWLLGLSALDLAAISFSVSLSGGFNSPYFALYYFAVAVFAYVFTAPRFVQPWTTLVVVVYSVLSVAVEPGLDLAGKEESSLVYRVVALYAVSAAVGIITGLEREIRRRGLEREGELQRQRIEISQTIHDTTAQWAYMIGLGVAGALELVDQSQAALRAKLRLVAELSPVGHVGAKAPHRRRAAIPGRGTGRGAGNPRRDLHRHHLGAGGAGAAWPGAPRCPSLTGACSSPSPTTP